MSKDIYNELLLSSSKFERKIQSHTPYPTVSPYITEINELHNEIIIIFDE